MPAEPTRIEIPVAWGDMDAFGHVNNTIYLRWFESARIAFFREVEVPHRGHGKASTEAPILAHTSCNFERPLTFPDTVRVTATVARVGTKSFTLRYEVWSEALADRAAHGDSVVVWFHYGNGVSTVLPDDLRARLVARLSDDG